MIASVVQSARASGPDSVKTFIGLLMCGASGTSTCFCGLPASSDSRWARCAAM